MFVVVRDSTLACPLMDVLLNNQANVIDAWKYVGREDYIV